MATKKNRGKWASGKSGNPSGRPKQIKLLSEVLREASVARMEAAPQRISFRKYLARMVWDGLTQGTLRFSDGRVIELGARDWMDLVKWVFANVENAQARKIEVEKDDEPAINGSEPPFEFYWPDEGKPKEPVPPPFEFYWPDSESEQQAIVEQA